MDSESEGFGQQIRKTLDSESEGFGHLLPKFNEHSISIEWISFGAKRRYSQFLIN